MENYEIFKNLESFQTRLRELEEAIDVEKLEESIASMEYKNIGCYPENLACFRRYGSSNPSC